MAILPPPRRRDQPTEVVPDGVFAVGAEHSTVVVADEPPEIVIENPEVRARLEEIRRDAQAAARERSLDGGFPSPPAAPIDLSKLPPPPPPSAAPRVPPAPPTASVAAIGMDPTPMGRTPAPPTMPPVNGHANGHHAPTNGHEVANGHAIVNGHQEGDPTLFGSAPRATDPTLEIDLRGPQSPRADTQQPGTLIAENVSAWFGTKRILERVSLPMRAGRVTAIIGPSGCGKSVFLRNLNRMHEVIPTAKMAGQITLDGVDIHGDTMSPTEVRLRIGMVFQRPNPFPAMTIGENVLAGLKLSGTKTNAGDELIEWCLRRAGLWTEVKDRLNTGGSALSGGQQQRLCIARALALKPKVLLMDEPCSALDPISTRVIEETILEIAKEITVVIVTHNMQQAQRVADDCAFFLIERIGDPGRVVEFGETEQIFNNPSDARTGDYVSGRFG